MVRDAMSDQSAKEKPRWVYPEDEPDAFLVFWKRVALVIGLPVVWVFGALQGVVAITVMWWEIVTDKDPQLW